MYLLDTNVCIQLLNYRNTATERRFRQHTPNEIHLCSVVKAELLFRARHSQHIEANLQRLQRFFAPLGSYFFDDCGAEYYARCRQQLSLQGNLIGPNDLMIAAIAMANDAVLVTYNTREFSRIPGLRYLDWEIG